MGRYSPAYTKSVTIAAGESNSGSASISAISDVYGLALRGNWEDMDTADLGIQVSYDDGTTWNNLWRLNTAEDGYEALRVKDPSAITGVADGDVVEVPTKAWMIQNAPLIRLVSRNTTTYATVVNQTNAITIEIGTLG